MTTKPMSTTCVGCFFSPLSADRSFVFVARPSLHADY